MKMLWNSRYRRDPAPKSAKSGSDGVTKGDIVASIEMIFGRTPEPALIEYHRKLGFPDRAALGRYMISTAEFRDRYAAMTGGGGGAARPISVFLGDRVLTLTHRGQAIYLVPLDLSLTPAILLSGTYEPHVEEVVARSIRPGDTVIDIGANVGYHTLAMATAAGTDGRVHAFEANPELMPLLESTMFVNGFSAWNGGSGDYRVSLYNNAVSDQPGTITLASAPAHFGSGHIALDTDAADYCTAYPKRVEVAATTLDAELADRLPTVDFLHMDIEGAEPLALRGGQALIERSPQLKIVTEWSVGMMSTRADVAAHVDWLIGLGFRFWVIELGATLTGIDARSALNLPLCDLFISRADPV
jgi:FkbM family methyltransferase